MFRECEFCVFDFISQPGFILYITVKGYPSRSVPVEILFFLGHFLISAFSIIEKITILEERGHNRWRDFGTANLNPTD